MAPELVAAFIDEFNTEFHRLAADAEAERDAAHQALTDANRKIAGILKAIEDGAYHPSLKERLTLLEREKTAAAARPRPNRCCGYIPTFERSTGRR
jgi:site-specific DNA recombinase